MKDVVGYRDSSQLTGDVIDKHLETELVTPRGAHSQTRYQEHVPGTRPHPLKIHEWNPSKDISETRTPL